MIGGSQDGLPTTLSEIRLKLLFDAGSIGTLKVLRQLQSRKRKTSLRRMMNMDVRTVLRWVFKTALVFVGKDANISKSSWILLTILTAIQLIAPEYWCYLSSTKRFRMKRTSTFLVTEDWMAATVTTDEEILQVWQDFKKSRRISPITKTSAIGWSNVTCRWFATTANEFGNVCPTVSNSTT